VLTPLLVFVAVVASAQVAPPVSSSAVGTPEFPEPTLRQFPQELGRNFAALVSWDNLTPVLAGSAATALAKIPNDRVETYFATKDKLPFHEAGDQMGRVLIAAPVMAGLLVAGRTSGDSRFRSFTYSLAQGYVINQSIVAGIKYAAQSDRPNGENSLSFPSGHTAGAFTVATTVSHYYGWKAGIPAYLGAAYVGYARLDDRAHRLTDVVAGATIGYIVGRTVSRRADPNSRFHLGAATPAGGGIGMTLEYRLPSGW